MNILAIGKFSADQFGFHIADTLKDMNHNVYTYDPALIIKYYKTKIFMRIHQFNHLVYDNLLMLPSVRKLMRQKLYKIITNSDIELIICTHDFLYPDEIEKIKKFSNAKIVMWFPDSIAYFAKAFFFVSDYDVLFFKDPYIVKILYEQYNKKNVFYLPECCNPKYQKSISLNNDDIAKYGCDITTYGSPHNIRSSFFRQLIDFNYSIKIWGHQPPIWLTDEKIRKLYMGEYVFNDSKVKSVLAAKINLNTLHPSEIFGLNARTFEVAGIGGFQMIHWRLGLQQLFDDGKEIVSFRNFDELIEKIDFYLSSPEERDQIAKAGSERAFSDHTYSLRLNLLLETVLGSKKGYDMPEVKMM